ncbi:conjugal transfer protein MobB [Flavobacterium chungbukense]|uniref:Conjugal transfer protein MobB n=1 Tax=Flavobacterium chungbukense TaxID=877464 RepID=A0ABP7XUC3_9FLAO|nr:conjugal transfer protein MobB [Flavobacterium chungbukense]MCC4921581.1 relaxase/mobilization nuclease domain-containing protein [Flavobacterium chungbukense]
MIAKITRGISLYGAIAYNYNKLEKGNAQVLFTQKIIQSPDGSYSAGQLSRSFELHLLVNRKTEKPILHISLNPDPKDNVSDTDFENMAQVYMRQMGYGNQPFVVFKHTDTGRAHIHIVSVCVDELGRKISDKFEKRRSMEVCRTLEKKYSLVSAADKKQESGNPGFKPVDFKSGDIKSQMASVLRHLPKYYQFQTFGAYNALLSLFNITAEEVKGEYNGIRKQGVVYFALNRQGEKAGSPFKASLFGKNAGLAQLQSQCDQNRIKLKDSTVKESLKERIESVMRTASNESEFSKKLIQEGINIVVRRNAAGRIYGITFIDHKSRSVWNGSELAKNLSANSFNDWWNNNTKPENPVHKSSVSEKDVIMKPETGQSPDMFDLLRNENMHHAYEQNSFDVLGILLPHTQAEDYQEHAFDKRMKRKVKRRRL